MSEPRKNTLGNIFGNLKITPWRMLPVNLLRMNLTANEKLVIVGIIATWPQKVISQNELAEKTSLGLSTVKRILCDLVKAGLIERRRTITGNNYDLTPLWNQVYAIGNGDLDDDGLEIPSEWPSAVVNKIMIECAPIYYLSLHEESCLSTLKNLIEESGERDTPLAISHVTESYQSWLRQHATLNRDRKVKFETLIRDRYSDYLNALPPDKEPLGMIEFAANISPEKEI